MYYFSLETIFLNEYQFQDFNIRINKYNKYMLFKIQENPISQQAYKKNLQIYEQYKDLLFKRPQLNLEFLSKYFSILQSKIEQEKLLIEYDSTPAFNGRGGNNIAQNVKKSALSLIRKVLAPIQQVYLKFKKQCIDQHELKSQKENIVIFFLYLYKFKNEGQLSLEDIKLIQSKFKAKLSKYKSNAERKMQQQKDRKRFHSKNIQQFNKFLNLDLDFTQPKSFKELSISLQSFYLRKIREYNKSLKRLLIVINKDEFFKKLFYDIDGFITKEKDHISSL